jgi:hypothetical protein
MDNRNSYLSNSESVIQTESRAQLEDLRNTSMRPTPNPSLPVDVARKPWEGYYRPHISPRSITPLIERPKRSVHLIDPSKRVGNKNPFRMSHSSTLHTNSRRESIPNQIFSPAFSQQDEKPSYQDTQQIGHSVPKDEFSPLKLPGANQSGLATAGEQRTGTRVPLNPESVGKTKASVGSSQRTFSQLQELGQAASVTIIEGAHLDFESKDSLPYELIKNLGHGASASVEMVKDVTSGSIYARKIFRNVRNPRYSVFHRYVASCSFVISSRGQPINFVPSNLGLFKKHPRRKKTVPERSSRHAPARVSSSHNPSLCNIHRPARACTHLNSCRGWRRSSRILARLSRCRICRSYRSKYICHSPKSYRLPREWSSFHA